MKVIVLGGAGDMGSAAVRDLASDASIERLTIADRDLAAAQRLATALGGGRIQGAGVDVEAPETAVALIRGHDVVAGAVGPFYRFEAPMVRAAIEAGVDYVSICDDYDAARNVLALDAEARRAGVTVLTGLGWTPGLSNVLARRAADRMDHVREINVSWAGSASDSEGFAVILHTIHIFTGAVPSFQNGRWVEVPAGSDPERVRFPAPLGEVEVFHLGHPEPVTLPRFLPGLRTVTLKGGLSERTLNRLALALARLRLTDTPAKKARVGALIERAMPLLSRLGRPAQPCSGIRVDVRGRLGGEDLTISYGATGHMAQLTGIPLAIGARMLARGAIDATGVVAPEACVPPDEFLAQLGQRGIVTYEMGIDHPLEAVPTAVRS